MTRVVVVDDQRLNLKMVCMTLESEGYEVIPLQDPMDLENLIQKFRIDAIILDLMMPGLSGFELIELLRKNPQTKNTPIIVLTSRTEAPDRVRGLRAGANDYICKPFDPAELIARLEGLLERQVREEMSLQGSLKATPVHELFQFIMQNSKTGTLHIKSQEQMGYLRIHKGLILDASFGPYYGVHAAEVMLELNEGSFRMHYEEFSPSEVDTPHPQIQQLLLNYAWVLDELSSRKQWLPEDSQGLWVRKNLTQLPTSIDRAPKKEVAIQIKAVPGISLEGLLSRKIGPPNQVRLALAMLIEQDLVSTSADTSASIVS